MTLIPPTKPTTAPPAPTRVARPGRLSIAMVCYPSLGGSGVIASELARGLAERDHTVHLIASARPWRAIESPRLFFHQVDVPRHPVLEHPPYSLAVAAAIVRVARAHPIDLVQAHYAVPHATSAFLAREILGRAPGRSAPLRIVTSLHGSDVSVVGSDPSLRSVTSFAIASSDGVTAPSEFLRREAHARLDLPAGLSIEVTPNFVDTDRFAPAPEVARGRELVLLHASNFRPVKRVGDLLAVLAHVRREAPARLVLVGDGPERAGLEARVHAMGLAGQVSFLGRRDDFIAELQQADGFLLPSESESFGVAALEAQSAGVPVFAYRVGGLPEVVAGGAARLIEPFDVEAMARAVLDALAAPDRGAALGRAARAHVVASFRREPALDRCEAFLHRVMDGQPAAGAAGAAS